MAKTIKQLADLQPDTQNVNKGTVRGRGMVEASLRETGAGRSILADREGRIIAGNKTLEAWADIGGEIEVVRTKGDRLVVVQREDLDLADDSGTARKLAYYDNRAGEVGLEWDAEQLLADINAGVDLSAMFREDELDKLLGAMADDTGGDDHGGASTSTFFDRVIHRPKWNKKRTVRFLSLCAWNSKTKQADVKQLHALKAFGDFDSLCRQLADEVVTALDEFLGKAAIAWVTTPPRSHVKDRHFATDTAIEIAHLLDCPFVRAFEDTPRTDKSHPRQFRKHQQPQLVSGDIPNGLALLFDDVATSGTTLKYCAALLKKECAVLPLAWLYEDALEGVFDEF